MGSFVLPVFPASVAFAIGLCLGAYVNLLWICLEVFLLILFSHLFSFTPLQKCRAFLLVILVASGYFQLYDALHESQLKKVVDVGKSLVLTGEIDTKVKRDGDTVSFTLRVADVKDHPLIRRQGVFGFFSPDERIVVRLKLTEEEQIEEVNKWFIGDAVTGKMDVSLPEPARNPGSFDYRSYLRWQGIQVVANTTFQQIEVISNPKSLSGWFDRRQTKEGELLVQIYRNPEAAGYMKSLLLGIQTDITPALTDIYSRMGLLHVLAISGLHVTLVSSGWLWILRRVGVTGAFSFWLTCAFLLGYVCLVGASPSAVRSGIMGGIALFAIQFRHKTPMTTSWGYTLLFMLLMNPYQLWQAGFQLSFAVTLVLVIYVPMLELLKGKIARWIYTSISVAIVAQMASFPIIIYWFHQFSLLSWLINLIYVPIISFVILPAGYVSLIVAHAHPGLSYFLTETNTWILDVLHDWLQKADQIWIPFHHWRQPGWWWYLLYGAICIGIPFLWIRGYHRIRDVSLYIVCIILLLFGLHQPFTGNQQVRITFLDVGQGDSIIVEIGKKKVYLIDGGGTFQSPQPTWKKKRDPFEVGKDTVLPYLRSRGIERIDTLVMTHPDNDHVGGLESILPFLQIERAFINTDTPKEAEQKILDYLGQKNVPVYTSSYPVQWEDQPGVQWSWLSPVAAPNEKELTGNDASVVLLLSAYGKRILFTGDLERTGEQQLIRRGGLPVVDILKAGHHGSKTSSSQELLDAVLPKTAVISVGRQNRYGHPHEEVLERFSAMKTKVFRTDEEGAITVVISPESIEMKAYLDDN
ncbi:DNA internalization-related competence protein ComEC/Rec2 [Brevibacillus sp. SYSU BS000544]|uniref:DNA internalization-related competence protein ComEC/Rec2 n=1 Tax=Brevibacillus sp. SYSU BS000544 TaxID=3416443 RepID=UPI003CE49227